MKILKEVAALMRKFPVITQKMSLSTAIFRIACLHHFLHQVKSWPEYSYNYDAVQNKLVLTKRFVLMQAPFSITFLSSFCNMLSMISLPYCNVGVK